MQNEEIITYLAGHLEYPSLDAAKAAWESKVARWEAKCYDECAWHGDSLVGLDNNGKKVIEIKCLLNHRFCNPPETEDGRELCEYIVKENEAYQNECSRY
jgi:hypothetical protein